MAKTKTKNKAKQATASPVALPKLGCTIADLRANGDLWYKIRVLIYDLRNIKTDKTSESRTLKTVDPLYISAPYFTPGEATVIKSALVDTHTTLEQAIETSLKSFFEKRSASGDFRPCGPHDMGPVYLECFGVEKADIEDEKFLSRLRRSGLGNG